MYHVDIINNGDSVFTVKSKDAQFAVDTKGKGMTPPDTLLASLGSCVGVYIRKYCDGAKIPINGFSVSVDGELIKESDAYFFKEITVTVDFKSTSFDERRKNAILTFIKNCPIHNTLKNNPVINIKI